jgi:hypothetical protein
MLDTHCPGVSVLELDRGDGQFDAVRVRGNAELRARVPIGAFRYRVRCLREGRLELPPIRSGRLSVTRDTATRPLPVSAVRITADADGRRYTVSYQNRLPIVTLRWPGAPRAAEYTLRVQPEHAAEFTIRARQPSVTLSGGRLADGLHHFGFEAGSARSAEGTLNVVFDFRARTAYLTSPAEGQPLAADRGDAHFAGGSVVGSSVSVQGVVLTLDGQGRFATNVAIPAGADGLAVRVQHPSTGIHYYVRHLLSPTAR